MLGTTHATNAVLERRGLDRVAVVRIGAAVDHRGAAADDAGRTTCARPCPAGEAVVGGGIEFDGREIVPLDADELRAVPGAARRARSTRVALTGVFAPSRSEQELAAAEVVREELGDECTSR